MSKLVEKHLPSHPESILAQWISQTIETPGLCVKLHLRGNNLHLLCERGDGSNLASNRKGDRAGAPSQVELLHRLLPALKTTDLNALTSADAPQIYQIQLYGCKMGQTHPDWTCTIYLNQLDGHLAQLQAKSTPVAQSQPADGEAAPDRTPPAEKFALSLSNRSLARQGHETAIASYLSETLSELGVAVRVSVKSIACTLNSSVYSTDIIRTTPTAKRLWIACEAPYSPDPSLIGESITQKLRDLEIEGYRDAVIRFQVAGEAQPDWLLRVDLTPSDEMLREWARWGDIEAVQRLLNQAVAHLGAEFSTASLKETTLHLFCSVMPGSAAAETTKVPALQQIRAEIVPLLETLGPQGIHAATIYGQVMGQDAPAWLERLELPAASHPALADSPLALALQEDWSAVAFLLHRLLNPDLDKYLATGGIRLQLLPRHDLLHIMSESSLCPDQHQVGQTIVRFLKQLKLPDVSGVRIYGRRAGQKHPLWNYGVDFIVRDRLVPEATPEFAATDAYISELVTQPDGEAIRPDLTPEDIQSAWANLHQRLLNWVQRGLIRSQLFTAQTNSTTHSLSVPSQMDSQASKIAIVWGIVGVLLVVQVNWLMERMLRHNAAKIAEMTQPVLPSRPNSAVPPSLPSSPSTSEVSSTQPVTSEELEEFPFPDLKWSRSIEADGEAADSEVFDSEGFIDSTSPSTESQQTDSQQTEQTSQSAPDAPKPGSPSASASPRSQPQTTTDSTLEQETDSALPYTRQNPAINLALAQSLATESTLPSFNSQQFNDKLELYYRVLAESGTPDILIVGSSRALRGVDPAALEQALAELGYAEVKVFNFGINGATAQVVDLLVRQILTPDQLPQIIIWADGARAFNSNAVDVTYNGVTASVAYQELAQGILQLPRPGQAETETRSTAATARREGIDITLTDSYQALDRWFSQQLAGATRTYKDRDRLKNLLQYGITRLVPSSSVEQPPVTSELLASDSRVPLSNLNPTLPTDYEFVDADGFLSLGLQFNPATYYQKYARVSGDYDRDYSEFQITGVQETALLTLLQYTQTQQVPVFLVNLPMTDEYLDSARQDYEQTFREYMIRLSLNQPGFKFHDLSEVWLTEYDYFSDPSHLNRYGAYAVSNRIAQDPRITWPKKTEERGQKSGEREPASGE